MPNPPTDPRDAFLAAAVWHGSLDRAEAILAAHPDVATQDIHTAAIRGDDAAVRAWLARDPRLAVERSGPLGWDALTHLCFSKYLRLDRARSAGFVGAATALLDAGASAATGFHDDTHQPEPAFESALYGACGVAHHAELTQLLVARGADPNDGEVAYHAPEGHDNSALQVLVESGRLTADTLAVMLVRKADWHDREGIGYLLAHGADPGRVTGWGYTALHQALRRDNARASIEAMLEHGADPAQRAPRDGRSAVSIAVRRGRRDVIALFESRRSPLPLVGVERLIAACARGDTDDVRAIADREPALVRELVAEGATLLAEFAGTANADGVARLLDLGVDVNARYGGDGYFDIAPGSTALQVAAWKAWPAPVLVLIARGADVEATDSRGRTPLMLAVRACVDWSWTERRSPASVDALLRAGASVRNVPYPSGYAEVDALLAARGSRLEA